MKKIINIFIVIFIAINFLYAYAQSQPPAPTPPKTIKEHKAYTNKNQNNSQISRQTISTISDQPKSKGANNNHEDYTSPEWWTVYVTGALVFVTTCLAIYTALLWRSTKFIAQDAKNAAALTKESVDLANKELILTQRPRLHVSNVITIDPFMQGKHVCGQFYIRNIGGTPATITDIGCWVHWFTDNILPMKRPYEGEKGNILDRPKLNPGEPCTIDFTSEEPLGLNSAAIMQRQHFLYVMGWIEYRDDLGINRRINFCRKYNTTIHRFSAVTDPDYESYESTS